MRRCLFALIPIALLFPVQQAFAEQCTAMNGEAINRLACTDPSSARFLQRIVRAQKALEKASPAGARPAVNSHAARWQKFAESWLAPTATSAQNPVGGDYAPRCASPRAMLFQRMDSLEKAVLTVKDNKPKSLDLCYDNAACLEPGATNSEMICETLFLGLEGVPANAEPLIIKLLGDWVAKGNPFETHIRKSTRNSEPCELVSETTMVEYLRGGFATIRVREGDTCNPQSGNEKVQTFDLRSGRALKISDFTSSPKELLNLLRKRKEADVLQALLRNQLRGDKNRPRIEPGECAELPFTSIDNVVVHLTSDGLRINKLFSETPPELVPCQFKVEEGLSPATLALLLKGKKSPASGMLKYIR